MSYIQAINYQRISDAIKFLTENFNKRPSLDDTAAHIHLSPQHFQKLFTDWAGTSPKKFLQYLSIQHAKKLLSDNRETTLFDTTIDIGLSSTSRLHDMFISIEGMTPAEYKNGGKQLRINYDFADSPFGKIIIASTQKGICFTAFEDDENKAVEDLRNLFPSATFSRQSDEMQKNALKIFTENKHDLHAVKLHLKGTPFQLKVWEALLKIPFGKLSAYKKIAHEIGNDNASRAVGTAIGSNPVAYLIPCHRVIQSSGLFDGYRWGNTRKSAIIGWESAKTYGE